MNPEQSGRAGRAWPIVLIAVILALTTSCVWIMSRQSAGSAVEASAELDKASTIVQHVAFVLMVGLFAWHQRRVLAFLIKLAVRNWVIGAEIVLLLAIVYGAFGSFGVPELFWDDSTITVGVAGFSAMVFLELAWLAIYLVDYSRPTRSQNRRLEWNQVEPFVMDSGLLRLLRMPTQDVSPRWQLGWFLAIACLPGLFLLALPAFLPVIRPSSDPRLVEWTWLAGLLLAVAVPPILLFTRPISFFIRHVRRGFGKPMTPDRSGALLQHPGVLLWLLGSVYVAALIVDRFQPRWVVPAALFCLLMAMIAVVVAFFLSIRSRTAQVWTALLVLTTILLNSIQTYDPCYRGLAAYYPPDPLRRLIRLPSPFSGSDSNTPVELVDYQEKEVRRAGREAAVLSRKAILDAWKNSVGRPNGPGDPTSARPILVVVSTSGGALRAGLWTAAVLDAIGTELPEFPRHVRYVTGASGGMVGAALFVTSRVRSPGAGALPAAPPATGGLADRLSNDYLSPITRQYILRDLPFAIFPWRQSYDRGDALEDTMVVDCKLTELGSTFSQLLDAERQGHIPSLVFSPMLVEDGRRLLISNLDLDDLTTIDGANLLSESHDEIVNLIETETGKKPLPRDSLEFRRINAISAVEFFRLFPQARDSFKVITAVRMNATFPVVTPTGILPTDSPRQVVDAGYYDNYGVDLATALIFAHRDWIASNTAGVLLVQIRAFRNEKQLKVLDQPILSEGLVNTASNVINILARGFRWLISPVTGLAEARGAVMHYRNDGQVDVLDHYFRDRVKSDPDFFKTVVFTCDTEIKSTDEQQVETLNWHLSDEEMTQIKKNMTGRHQNQMRLKKLIAWWHQRGS
jgi:hypothetical protein